MGVGYQVSALHRLTFLDTAALHLRPIVRGDDPQLDEIADAIGANRVAGGPFSIKSTATEPAINLRG